ncbi:MAG: ATP-binding cassette domain-containing protein [Syntrophaceae bacterium]|nr:ATP-binding cassette domain-containing protein [Syntrophaceae bacterium]
MIHLEHVSYAYAGHPRPVLDDLSLSIREGEHLALFGANGCGKTTLVRHLNALLLPGQGTVAIDGLVTSDPAHWPEIRRRVGMIFQHPDNQIVGMTAEEDVAFGPGNLGWMPEEIRRRVGVALDRFGLLPLADRPPHTLSGGEKRLLSIAGVLVMEPRYIAFDEPAAYLDPVGRQQVREAMKRLSAEGIAVIHVTHDAEDMAAADRLIVMEAGRVILDGAPRDSFPELARRAISGFSLPPLMELVERLNAQGWRLSQNLTEAAEISREIHDHLLAASRQKPSAGRE